MVCSNFTKSAEVSTEIAGNDSMYAFEAQMTQVRPPGLSNDRNGEEVPAPTRFVRRKRAEQTWGKALVPLVKAAQTGPSTCVKGGIECFRMIPHTPKGVGEDMWSFLGPSTSTHGVQSKYYAAHREYVGKLLSSSDTQDEFRHVDGWDKALYSLA
jgi:hypothetical protein